MSDRRSSPRPQASAKRPEHLSPELKEFLHMLQVIEDDPGTCTRAAAPSAD